MNYSFFIFHVMTEYFTINLMNESLTCCWQGNHSVLGDIWNSDAHNKEAISIAISFVRRWLNGGGYANNNGGGDATSNFKFGYSQESSPIRL